MEAVVQKNYGFLYNRMRDFTKGDIALKRADAILDSINKDEEAKLMAIETAKQDTTNIKKVDSLPKKKVFVSVVKKPVKKAPSKKIVASL